MTTLWVPVKKKKDNMQEYMHSAGREMQILRKIKREF